MSTVRYSGRLFHADGPAQGPRIHLPVTYFLFRDTTSLLVRALSASLRPKYRTPYLFTSANPKHNLPSDVILRRTAFCQPILPPSGPCNVPWFSSKTLVLCKSLTYLLTYLKMSLATAGIYCMISPPLSGAMEDCSIVHVQQLQMLYRRRCCHRARKWIRPIFDSSRGHTRANPSSWVLKYRYVSTILSIRTGDASKTQHFV